MGVSNLHIQQTCSHIYFESGYEANSNKIPIFVFLLAPCWSPPAPEGNVCPLHQLADQHCPSVICHVWLSIKTDILQRAYLFWNK